MSEIDKAFHEAAHGVAAVVYGRRNVRASLAGGGWVTSEMRLPPSPAEIDGALIMHFAGGAGEAKHVGSTDAEFYTSASDWAAALAVVADLPVERREALLRKGQRRARAFAYDMAPAISAVASRLLDAGTLGEDEIVEVALAALSEARRSEQVEPPPSALDALDRALIEFERQYGAALSARLDAAPDPSPAASPRPAQEEIVSRDVEVETMQKLVGVLTQALEKGLAAVAASQTAIAQALEKLGAQPAPVVKVPKQAITVTAVLQVPKTRKKVSQTALGYEIVTEPEPDA